MLLRILNGLQPACPVWAVPAPGSQRQEHLHCPGEVPEHRLQERATLHCLCNPHLPSDLLAQRPTVGRFWALIRGRLQPPHHKQRRACALLITGSRPGRRQPAGGHRSGLWAPLGPEGTAQGCGHRPGLWAPPGAIGTAWGCGPCPGLWAPPGTVGPARPCGPCPARGPRAGRRGTAGSAPCRPRGAQYREERRGTPGRRGPFDGSGGWRVGGRSSLSQWRR